MFCDAHFHIVQCSLTNRFSVPFVSYRACTCSHSKNEFFRQENILSTIDSSLSIYSSFGIHPQNPVTNYIAFLEQLLEEKKLDAIGEAGFDFFTPDFKLSTDEQETVWRAQIELAVSYGKPLIVHCRKATDRLFRDTRILEKIPAVVFHSFMGNFIEAGSLLRHGINGFFSFGKQILNGNKRSIECVSRLDSSRLLFETDAPFQTLKGEKETYPCEIRRIYEKAAELRFCSDSDALEQEIENNFIAVYGEFPVRLR